MLLLLHVPGAEIQRACVYGVFSVCIYRESHEMTNVGVSLCKKSHVYDCCKDRLDLGSIGELRVFLSLRASSRFIAKH